MQVTSACITSNLPRLGGGIYVVEVAGFNAPNHAGLLARGRAGDSLAIGQLYDETFPCVFQFAARITATREDAEDVTAETYERALRSLHRYDSEQGPIAAWLCGIARNVAHEHARKRGWPLVVSLLPEVLDRLPGRADTVERSRRDDLLDELTAAQREVVSLRLAGFKVREIACTLGKADGTIKALQFGAMKRLREAAAR